MMSLNLSQLPAGPPPDGEQSNFINPHSRAKALIVINAVFVSLMLCFVAIRVYAKGVIIRALGWDDYTCIFAAIGSIAHTSLMMSILQFGYGRHLWDIRAISLTPGTARKLNGISIIYGPVIFFVKLSILLLYKHLFSVNNTLQRLIYFGIGFQVAFYLAYLGVQIRSDTFCDRPANLASSFCSQIFITVVVQGVFNVITDFYVLTLPIPLVLRLQIEAKRKWGLVAIFMTGFLACMVSLIRLVFLCVHFHEIDGLWDAALLSEFTIVEMNIGIIAGCMSAMPPFFSHYKMFSLSTYKTLQSRLLSGRSRSKPGSSSSYGSKELCGSDSFSKKNIQAKASTYYELTNLAKFEGGVSEQAHSSEEDSETIGIVRRDEYSVS